MTMQEQDFDRMELLELAEAAIEGRLTESEKGHLEHWVVSNRIAARIYTEYVSLHASLRITNGTPVPLPLSQLSGRFLAAGTSASESHPSTSHRSTTIHVPSLWSRLASIQVGFMALAVSIGLALGFGFAIRQQPSPIATLAETKGCKWGPGTLPTIVDSRLAAGRLRLAEGLARVVFDNGVEVRLESPADFELVTPMKCVMRAGKIVAHVPPNAKGFVVETPSSIVTDFGTEFGVSVGSDESAVVQVFQGRVDTLHRHTGKTEIMTQGAVFLFGNQSYGPHQNAERSTIADPSGSVDSSSDWVHLSTADGRGRDVYIQPMEFIEDHRSQTLLLVKRPFREQNQWERLAYLGFDLAEIGQKRVIEAELSLCFAPTGLGFASLVPDATFHVYGLVHESSDQWNEAELAWENAPVRGGVDELNADSQVRLLGKFDLPQGDQTSTVTVSGPLLCEFLNSDTNQMATLIVVRKTIGEGPSDLVHGFASRRHPTLPPPSLRLKFSDR